MKLLSNREKGSIRFGRTWLMSLVGVAAFALVSFQPAAAFAAGGGHGGGGHGGGFGGHGGGFGVHGGGFNHSWGGRGYHGGGYYGSHHGYGHYGYGWRGYGWGGYGWYGGYPYYPYYYQRYYPSYDLNDYSGYSTPYDYGYGGYLNNDFTITPAPAYEPPATSGQSPASTTATVEVRVPDSLAAVTFDGHETMTRGTERTYQTPALTPGEKYVYDVTATWTENGRQIKQNRKVNVAAGGVAVIDFTKPAPATTSQDSKAPITASK